MRIYELVRDNPATAMEACTDPAAVPENELFVPGNPGSTAQDHKHSEHAPPAAPLITPLQLDSPQSLSQAAEAPTGAPDRFACSSPAPPVHGAQQQLSLGAHPSARPRALASPAPPAQGDGGCQHAPALTESAKALTESAGVLIASAPAAAYAA